MSTRRVTTIHGERARVRVMYNSELEEYSVRVIGAPAVTTYYTTDRADAMGTARLLAATYITIDTTTND